MVVWLLLQYCGNVLCCVVLCVPSQRVSATGQVVRGVGGVAAAVLWCVLCRAVYVECWCIKHCCLDGMYALLVWSWAWFCCCVSCKDGVWPCTQLIELSELST